MPSSLLSVLPFVAVLSAVWLAGIAVVLQILPFLDCMGMIAALEYNRHAIKRRQVRARQAIGPGPGYTACCIGYKETRETFQACLQSYKAHAENCQIYFTMLDGSFEENADMTVTFEEEFGTSAGQRISYERPLGLMYEDIISRKVEKELKPATQAASEAFATVLEYVKEQLSPRLPSILENKKHTFAAVLISQPHVGMKEVRFAAWMTSVALAELLQIEYMWSSDSDSCITQSCVPDCIAAICGDDSSGASSAGLAVRDRHSTFFNQLYGGYYQCEGNLHWSAAGCAGKSNCIQGPSACHRVKAIKSLLGEWYSQRIRGEKVWVNEDLHMTALVAREGWSTLFVVNAVVLSEAVESYKAWFKQTMRWERGPHLERLATPLMAFNPRQGPVRLVVNLRDVVLQPFIFVYLAHAAITGRGFPAANPWLGVELMASQLVQRCWSVGRAPEIRGNWLGSALAALLYLVGYPFANIWALCTLMDDTWASSTKYLTTPTIGLCCFAVWVAVCGLALARLVYG